MNAAVRSTLAALALCMLAACGGGATAPDDDAASAADDAAAELGRDTDETVFDDMIETQDRARAVEGVTLGRKQDLEQALEASAGDATAAAAEE